MNTPISNCKINNIFTSSEWKIIVENLSLSHRQEEVVYCLLSGLSDKQISQKLVISLATVRTHMSRLFLKYQVEDRGGIILLVFKKYRELFCPFVR